MNKNVQIITLSLRWIISHINVKGTKRVSIKINNKKHKIRCPAFSRFCDVSVCNGRGHLGYLGHDDNCECDPGFSGVDCEKTNL